MTAKKLSEPVSNAPMTYRDFPAEVPVSEPAAVAVAAEPVLAAEPGKPVTKKEN
jgi:hypothetical protein